MEKFAAVRHAVRHEGRVVYEWDQTLEEVNAYVPAPPGAPASAIDCVFGGTRLRLGIKGNPPYVEGEMPHAVKSSECFWTLEDGAIHISLQKLQPGRAWPCLLLGHGELDPFADEGERKRLLLERYQAETPGFDFSGAEVSGTARDATR